MGEFALLAVLGIAVLILLHERGLELFPPLDSGTPAPEPALPEAEPDWLGLDPFWPADPGPGVDESMPPVMLQTSNTGLSFIRGYEGLRLTAYQDAVGIWTIGYGHTGADVRGGLTISRAQAEALFRADLAGAEGAVQSLVTVPLAQSQFDALVSFVFNLGAGPLARSTLLRKLNSGDYRGAAAEFTRWVYAGGQRLLGLVTRRQAEAALFRAGSTAG